MSRFFDRDRPSEVREETPSGLGDGAVLRQQAAILVVTLLVLDVFVLVGNVLHDLGPGAVAFFSEEPWDGRDGSYGEMLGHAMMVLTTIMLLSLWRSRSSPIYAAWALVFATVAADDFLMLHERGGARIEAKMGWPELFGLRARDLGELVTWAALGGALLVVLVIATRRSERHHRSVSTAFVALMGLLALFAVVVDMISAAMQPLLPDGGYSLVRFVETAGELGAMTIITVAAHRMTLGLSVVPRRFRHRAPR